jgi:hypothetical protein
LSVGDCPGYRRSLLMSITPQKGVEPKNLQNGHNAQARESRYRVSEWQREDNRYKLGSQQIQFRSG